MSHASEGTEGARLGRKPWQRENKSERTKKGEDFRLDYEFAL